MRVRNRRMFNKAAGLPSLPSPPSGLLWSDPATWGGTLPVSGQPITIPNGVEITYDLTDSPELGLVTLEDGGKLNFDRTKTQTFRVSGMMVIGELFDSTPEAPRSYATKLTIELTGAFADAGKTPRADGGFSSPTNTCRGIMFAPGHKARFHGADVVRKTILADGAHWEAGQTTITTETVTGWKAGQRILVAPTGLVNQTVPEVLTLAGDAVGTSVTFTAGPLTKRCGRKQYVVETAVGVGTMSYTPGGYVPPHPNTATVLDQRATLTLLDAAITIQGKNDADWSTNKHGAVVMVMGQGNNSSHHCKGVRFTRAGQQDTQGHYPWHAHNMSYDSGGAAYLGLASDTYIRDCVVDDSVNRGIVVHGTDGLTVDGCAIHNFRGQGLFTEDGIERFNNFTNNTISSGRKTVNGGVSGQGLKFFESFGSAGIWLTNPNNTVTGNESFGNDGVGSWFSFASRVFGDNFASTMEPFRQPVGLVDLNTVHSNSQQGHRLELVVVDERGNFSGGTYVGPEMYSAPPFTRFRIWKNLEGGYQNRINLADYREWIQADNVGGDFFGAHNLESGGLASRCTLVSQSLNNWDTVPAGFRYGIASYHGSLNPESCIFVGYAPSASVELRASGVRFLWDLYIGSIQKLIAQGSTNNRLLSSHPGVLQPSPEYDEIGPVERQFLITNNTTAEFAPMGYGTPTNFRRRTEPSGGYFKIGWNAAPVGDGASRMAKLAYGVTSNSLQASRDGWISVRKPNNTGSDQVIGFDVADVGGQGPLQSAVAYRARIKTNGEVWVGVGAAADAAMPTQFTFSSFTTGNEVRLFRTGTTGVVVLQTSTGGGWTTRYTFAATSTAALHRYAMAIYTGSATLDVLENPQKDNQVFRRWKLSSAILDNGEWGNAGNYMVPNLPYFTFGISHSAIAVGSCPYHRTTATKYISLDSITFEGDDFLYGAGTAKKLYERINPADNSVQGTWVNHERATMSETPSDSVVMGSGGEYAFRFPNNPPAARAANPSLTSSAIPFKFQTSVSNYSLDFDGVLIWFEWPAGIAPRPWITTETYSETLFNADGTPTADVVSTGQAQVSTAISGADDAAKIAALRAYDGTTIRHHWDQTRNLVGLKIPNSLTPSIVTARGGFFRLGIVQ